MYSVEVGMIFCKKLPIEKKEKQHFVSLAASIREIPAFASQLRSALSWYMSGWLRTVRARTHPTTNRTRCRVINYTLLCTTSLSLPVHEAIVVTATSRHHSLLGGFCDGISAWLTELAIRQLCMYRYVTIRYETGTK